MVQTPLQRQISVSGSETSPRQREGGTEKYGDGEERTHTVKRSTLASGSHVLICPICEAGELLSGGNNEVRCSVCGYAPDRGVLEALWKIISLPDAIGNHACEECSHPEMRRLPDGISHCPGCGSEVLPADGVSAKQTKTQL